MNNVMLFLTTNKKGSEMSLFQKWEKLDTFNNKSDKELIEHHIPLALELAKKFPAKYIELDDARSIALLELTRCVKNRKSLRYLSAYINKCVYLKIQTHCVRTHEKPMIKHYKQDTLPERVELTDQNEPSYSHYFPKEFEEVLETVILTTSERVVMTMFLEEYKLKEIAEVLQVSHQRISQLKDRVLDRLKGVYDDN